MELGSWQGNNSKVKYTPVVNGEFQSVEAVTDMDSVKTEKGDMNLFKTEKGDVNMFKTENEDKDLSQSTAPVESPEMYLDDIDGSQQKLEEPHPNDYQQSESDFKDDASFNGIKFLSRAGEGDGPTGTTLSSDGAAADGGSTKITLDVGNANIPNGRWPDSVFNFTNNGASEFGGVTPESTPDVNIYQHKKTVAQGMMDLALFSANANQLRYVLESSNHPYYWPGIVLISISLMFQVGVGVGLLMNTRYNVKDKKEICIANKISNFTIVGIFLVTVINVFISGFGVASGGPVIISPRSGDDTE